jgi:hypothetical protein
MKITWAFLCGILVSSILNPDVCCAQFGRGPDVGSTIVVFLVIILIMFIIFLIGRELVCWYFKINQMIQILQTISSKLSGANFHPSTSSAASATASSISTVCSSCLKSYDGDLRGQFCENCGKPLSEIKTEVIQSPIGSKKYCFSCGRTDAYYDANGGLFCPNCKKYVER